MRSLRCACKNIKPALILLVQEMLLFLLFFLVFSKWFFDLRGSGPLAVRFNLIQFAALLMESPAASQVSRSFFLFFVLFILLRVFFTGGVFTSLVEGYRGLGSFLAHSARHFWRFTAALILFAVPAFILSGFLAMILNKLVETVDHTKWVLYLTLLKQYLLFLFISLCYYFLTSSRWAMVKSGRFTLSFRPSGKKLFAYLGYNTLGLIALLSGALLGLLFSWRRSSLLFLLGIPAILLGFLFKILFQFAAYKSVE